jgi:NodT family efflux transporter outer membrane factor (OMF) lipoprotein
MSSCSAIVQRLARGASLAVLALLAGCTLGPDFLRPEGPLFKDYFAGEGTRDRAEAALAADAEKPQRVVVGAKLPAEWWDLFRSPQLKSVVAQAIDGNRSLAAARATLAQAQESAYQAGAARLPSAQMEGGASRQHANYAGAGFDQAGPTSNLFSLGPSVSYNFDLFGGAARQSERQQALAEYQEYQLAGAYLAITGNAVLQAVQIASLRAQLKAVEELVAQDERNLASVEKLFRLQEATRIDVESARSQLATDRTQLPPLRQALSQTRHALTVLIGKAPAEWLPPEFDLDEFTLPEELPLSVPSGLVRQRPDVLAAEAQLHAASAQVGVATAALYPNLSLSAGMGQQALSPSTLFSGPAGIWNVANSLTAPLFNWGALDAQKRSSERALEASLATYQHTVLTSFAQVADLLDALTHDTELLEAQRIAVASTFSSVKLTRAAYAMGDAKLIQVLDAERLYQQARLGHVRTRAQRLSDTARLFAAVGGAWADWRDRERAAPLAVAKAK